MKKTRAFALWLVCAQGALACGSTESDPILGSDGGSSGSMAGANASAGKGGMNGGSSGTTGKGGSSGASGGNGAGRGGTGSSTGGSSAGAADEGGSGGSDSTGDAGESGMPATGGSSTSGGSSAGGASGASGATGEDGGAAGEAGVECNPVHPNVDGDLRTCNPGFCYCPGNDGCFDAGVASSCCVEPVVCEEGATDPVATINHPGDGEIREAGNPIPFVGVATDPQDGALSGDSLVWTSSELSTPIGTGLSFEAALVAGTHVITLTATDSDSNAGTDSITLVIE